MKKNTFIYILCAIFLSSCSRDFIDLQPISSTTSTNFYQNADDIQNALNGAYATLQAGGISTNNYVFGEIRSDNTTPVVSGSVTDQDEFDRFYIRSTNPFINSRWNDGYRAITRCNIILKRIDDIEMDEALKIRIKAETKFIRGYVYFELVRTYGDLPLVLEEIQDSDEGYDYERSPQAEVYAQIENDLLQAIPDLPLSYSGTEIGRATSGACQALLGKVYLTQHKYELSRDELNKVIVSGEYNLLPDYAFVFDADNGNNEEVIFAVQFLSGGVGEGNPWPNAFAPENSGNAVIPFGGGGNNQPTTDLIESYEMGDVRKEFSLATSYENNNGDTIPYNFVTKYRDVPATSGDNNNNIPIIRYADVLLMQAEVLNELGYQNNGDAFEYINQVRARAGLENLSAGSISNQQEFRIAVENERRVELAFEGHRWFDLVRTERAVEVMNGKQEQFNLVRPVTQNQLIFPIPQSQIDLNGDRIKQNPGY